MEFGGKKILSSRVKQIIFWLVIIASVAIFYKLIAGNPLTGKVPQQITYDEAVSRIKSGDIVYITQKPSQL